jgi:hypothetical protein
MLAVRFGGGPVEAVFVKTRICAVGFAVASKHGVES